MRGKRVTKVRGKRRKFLFCTTCSYAPPPANPRPRSVPHGIIIIPLFASRFRFKRSSHKTEGSETIYPRITYDADITIIVGKCESAHPSSVINTQTSADRLPSRHYSIQFALLRDVCRERFPPIPCPRARKEKRDRETTRQQELRTRQQGSFPRLLLGELPAFLSLPSKECWSQGRRPSIRGSWSCR